MLTGNLPLLNGECRILSPSGERLYLSKTSQKYFSNMGYCPQINVNVEVLTGREILTFFGKIRGISQGLDKEIENFAKCLAFDEFLNRPCGNYSGGNKRKLCIAVALIGLPYVILLDEPTSGVDPISRRAMWNTIQMAQNHSNKPAIVLTSHSMEECEVLCNKIAIMKAGKFHCYGNLAQLKSKYSQGFVVILKPTDSKDILLPLEKVNNLKLKFKQLFKDNCDLKVEGTSLLQYHINDLSKKWGDIFKNMEQFQKEFPIVEDYTIAETTLEEIFIKIAKSG